MAMVDSMEKLGRYYLITSDNSVRAFDAETVPDKNPLNDLTPRRVTIAQAFGRIFRSAAHDVTSHFNRAP